MTNRKVAFALALYDIGAFMDRTNICDKNPYGKGFKFKHHEKNPEAPLSPSYLNLRTPDNGGPLTPEIVREAGSMLFEMTVLKGLDYECACGIPKAGEPFVGAFAEAYLSAHKNPLPLVKLGKTISVSGRRVEGVSGFFVRGWRVLPLDDLISLTMTKEEALDELLRVGLLVTDLMLLVDREQGGIATLAKKYPNVHIHVIFTHTDLLTVYLNHGRITQNLHDEIIEYCRTNQ